MLERSDEWETDTSTSSGGTSGYAHTHTRVQSASSFNHGKLSRQHPQSGVTDTQAATNYSTVIESVVGCLGMSVRMDVGLLTAFSVANRRLPCKVKV